MNSDNRNKAKYVKPSNIADDMGGSGDCPDERMQEIMELLPHVPDNGESVLDIGFGKGQIPYYFREKRKTVTSIGLELESYGTDIEKAKNDGINVIEANVLNMPFDDNSFDTVVASHILEHISDMGTALAEIRRVLARGGQFVMFIPPYIPTVCAGHVNTGWNLGQLIYVLLLNGFDVKHGHFIHLPNNLCAIVKKSSRELPPLRGDRGDIQILNKGGYFPFEIKAKADGTADGFDSRGIVAVNWESFEGITMQVKSRKIRWTAMVFRLLYKILGDRLYGVVLAIDDVMYPGIINPGEL